MLSESNPLFPPGEDARGANEGHPAETSFAGIAPGAANNGSYKDPHPSQRRRANSLHKRETRATSPDGLFAGLETAPALLLAVSGGPDSMALLHLAAGWQKAPPLHVATVDHGLRSEAAAEAILVAEAAAKLGLSHRTLVWTGPKPATRLQERARDARYSLLAAQARSTGASHVLTAHHAGDQAETILLRLARGSGLSGLAGMRRETPLGPGLTLMRPLLGLTKAQLVKICVEAGLAYAEDPSNHDPRFARVKLRSQESAAAGLGLDPANLTRLATRLARADDALEAEGRRLMALADGAWHGAHFSARLDPARTAQAEIMIRLLRQAFEGLGDGAPKAKPLRLERLEALASAVQTALAARQSLRATFRGCCVTLGRDTMLAISPEPTRRRGRSL